MMVEFANVLASLLSTTFVNARGRQIFMVPHRYVRTAVMI